MGNRYFWPEIRSLSKKRMKLIRLGIAESCKYPSAFSNAVRALVKDRRRLAIIGVQKRRSASLWPADCRTNSVRWW